MHTLDLDLHLEVGSFDNNSNLAIAPDDDDDKEWVVVTWSVLDNAFSTRWWTELDFLVVSAFQGAADLTFHTKYMLN